MILAHTPSSYADFIRAHLGKGRLHAKLIYKEWLQHGQVTGNDPAFKNAKSLLKEILAITDLSHPTIVDQKKEGETIKCLLQAHDGLVFEMVLLPMKAGNTLCISSQVGCKMGCAFCETGKMGLVRHLAVEEIVSQLFVARHLLGQEVRNLVFMGMGEPLDNYDAVMKAVTIFSEGFSLGHSHITISTCGVVDKIYRLIEEAPASLNLAISVNAPDDETRSRLMPVNKLFAMNALKEAMVAYCAHPRRKIFIEYVLIEGRTDRLEHADALAGYLEGLNVTVNLIPYNPQRRGPFMPPSPEATEAFFERMKGHGYSVFVRGTKGQKILAACGQLACRKNPAKLSS